jgi:hypothetical protein
MPVKSKMDIANSISSTAAGVLGATYVPFQLTGPRANIPAEVLDPRAWPCILNAGVQMDVPLFNSTLPEDNEFFQCVFRN